MPTPRALTTHETAVGISYAPAWSGFSLFRRGHAGGKGREGGVASVSRFAVKITHLRQSAADGAPRWRRDIAGGASGIDLGYAVAVALEQDRRWRQRLRWGQHFGAWLGVYSP